MVEGGFVDGLEGVFLAAVEAGSELDQGRAACAGAEVTGDGCVCAVSLCRGGRGGCVRCCGRGSGSSSCGSSICSRGAGRDRASGRCDCLIDFIRGDVRNQEVLGEDASFSVVCVVA